MYRSYLKASFESHTVKDWRARSMSCILIENVFFHTPSNEVPFIGSDVFVQTEADQAGYSMRGSQIVITLTYKSDLFTT